MKSFQQLLRDAINVTDNPNFWRWFGNSKVVDAQGNPLVVYHGTAYNFSKFSGGIGQRRGISFFTVDPHEASSYADNTTTNHRDNYDDDDGNDTVYAVYLRIENPFNPDDPSHRAKIGMPDNPGTWEWMEIYAHDMKKAGFDGMLVREVEDAHIFDYAVFSGQQVKSAIGNNGDFDPNNPDITK